MAKKKSSMDPGMEDDGTYPSDDISVYSDEDTESPGDYGAAPTKTMRKSAAGRSLKRWSPGEDQLLLLFVDQVCMDLSVALPWDAIAKAMEPRPGNISGPMTGEAVKQHLAKLRTQREEAGQVVPPKVDRATRRRVASLSIEQLAGATPRGKSMATRSASTGIVKRSSLLAPLNKREQAAKNRKDLAEAAKIKKEAAEEEQIKDVPVFKTPAKKRNTKVAKAGARGNSSNTVGSTPAISSRKTGRSTGQSTGTKRARGQMPKVDEEDMETPTKRPRLRPTHVVNYTEPEVATPGGQEQDDDDYQEEIDATEERFGEASLASGGKNTADFRGNARNAYSGGSGRGDFDQYSGPRMMNSMASMAPAMDMTPTTNSTTNFSMGRGQTMEMYENMDYSSPSMGMNSQHWVGSGSGRGQSAFEGGFDGASNLSNFNPYSQPNITEAMYQSAPGTFSHLGGLPGSSSQNYANQMPQGISQNASFLEDCDEDYPPHLFQQTPALPSMGYGRSDDQQHSSFDSGVGSSVPQSPAKGAEAGANDRGMELGMGMSMGMGMDAGMGVTAGSEFDPFMGGTAFDDAYEEYGMKHERGSQGHDYSA